MQFVNITCLILRKTDIEAFFDNLNEQNSHIKFTYEPGVDGQMVF